MGHNVHTIVASINVRRIITVLGSRSRVRPGGDAPGLAVMADVDSRTAHLSAPLAVVDLAALVRNADELVRRAQGKPIRIATKSVRCREILDLVLARDGFAGLMAYSLAEAIWLVRHGATDVLVGYPSVDAQAITELGADEVLRAAITLTVDDPAHLQLIAGHAKAPVRICLDLDASLRIGPLHLGVRRSGLRTADDAVALMRQADAIGRTRVVGLMCYDAQIAGVPDTSPAVRMMKRRSLAELAKRRAAVVAAVRGATELEFVNAGGTGSLHAMGTQADITEVAAGSGLFGPTLFDDYDDFTPNPALIYALPVVRAPAPDVRTVYAGGYPASGPAGRSRVPTPIWPVGLHLLRSEGAGEVQTPVTGPAATDLAIGDRVWWRHAKAGEPCERFDELVLMDPGSTYLHQVPTYRGEGKCFG